MIVRDFKQLREVPVGRVVTFVMQMKVVEVTEGDKNVCGACAFRNNACAKCGKLTRPDGKEVKFIKI